MPIAFRSSGEDSRVSAKRLSAPVTHQRLVLNKAGFWPAQAPSRTALLAAALLGMAGIGAGCSSDSPVSGLVKDDDSSDSHSDARELPQGVIAPYQPVQPGDARLGADGHYDYTAEDFVLRHPCDDQELMAKLKEKGWEISPGTTSIIDEPNLKGCGLQNEAPDSIPFVLSAIRLKTIESKNNAEITRTNFSDISTAYSARLASPVGAMCFIGQETSHGAIGLSLNYSEFYHVKTEASACQHLLNDYKKIFGGK